MLVVGAHRPTVRATVATLEALKRPAPNLAHWDRIARLALGALLIALPLFGVVDGLAGLGCLLFSWIPLVTGAVGWCPIYSLTGISSRGG